MAGYMTKQLTNVYDGELINAASRPVVNGLIMERVGDTLVPATTTNSWFLCKEETTIYDGIEAQRFVVQDLNDNLYLVDNQVDVNTSGEYDGTYYLIPIGARLRAHPLRVGEEFVTDCFIDTAVDGIYEVKDGSVWYSDEILPGPV